jgi:hypothetical protein
MPHRDPDVDARAVPLEALVYELLDAHRDTERLAAEGLAAGETAWRVHLDYLRDLQRVGRELLAHASAVTDAGAPLQDRPRGSR